VAERQRWHGWAAVRGPARPPRRPARPRLAAISAPAPPSPWPDARAASAAPVALTDTATPTGNWDKIAACESGGDWNIDTGNGYYGGLQFNATTWHNYGGQGLPHQASKATQIAIADRVLAKQGWGAWPVCSRRAGLR
jgi:resuscitation-promoting factor RpfB